MRWAVVYRDRSTFTSDDGAPEDAPGEGVVVVGQEDDTVGFAVHSGSDFYVWSEDYGGWYGLDYFGLAQYIARPGLKIVKLGEAMHTSDYLELLKAVRAGGFLPAKSARYPWERALT